MTIYLINLFSVLFWAFFLTILKIKKTTRRKIFALILFIQLYLLLALRSSEVGADLNTYLLFFEKSKFEPFFSFDFSRYEIGYVLLNKLFGFITNKQIFIAIISFIPICIIFRFIYKESKILWLSVFLFITLGFFTNSFNIIRQVYAMSIITISYKYLIKNEIKKFIITILIASCFHTTAIVFVFVYYFKDLKISIKGYFIYSIIALVAYIGGDKIINFALSSFSTISYEVVSNGGESMLILLILILIITLIYRKDTLEQNPNSRVLYNIYFFTILIQILAIKFSLFVRVGLYFLLFSIILIPEVISSIRNKSMCLLVTFIILILTSALYFVNLNVDSSNIVPYNVFWK